MSVYTRVLCKDCEQPIAFCICKSVDAHGRAVVEPKEIYEGDLLITAHQAMEVLARKVGLKYEAGEGNDVYLTQIADAMLSTLKKQNSNTDIVVMRKR